MKQKKTVVASVACGVVCAVCVGAFVLNVQHDADAARAEVLARFGGEQVEVCVATRDIVAGERVDSSAVESRLWVADLLPESAVRMSAEVVGKTATSPILKGEVVSTKRFESDHGALDVPAGKEAVSVPAKSVQAVGGAVRSGMVVDVYSSGDANTAALASGVMVLDASVGKSGSISSGDSGYITLALDPERVQEVIAAANKSSLYFVLPGERGADGASEGARKADGAKEGERGAVSTNGGGGGSE